MKISVTNHAVCRYKERVVGADSMEDESIREVIRDKVDNGFKDGLVRDHPTEEGRRIIPFKAGKDILYLSIGPSKSVTVSADLAVIGVLYDRELGGRVSSGATLGDLVPNLLDFECTPKGPPKFILQIGKELSSIEMYRASSEEELDSLLERRKPDPDQVLVYELSERRGSGK